MCGGEEAYGSEAIDWEEKDICSRCEERSDIVVVLVWLVLIVYFVYLSQRDSQATPQP